MEHRRDHFRAGLGRQANTHYLALGGSRTGRLKDRQNSEAQSMSVESRTGHRRILRAIESTHRTNSNIDRWVTSRRIDTVRSIGSDGPPWTERIRRQKGPLGGRFSSGRSLAMDVSGSARVRTINKTCSVSYGPALLQVSVSETRRRTRAARFRAFAENGC